MNSLDELAIKHGTDKGPSGHGYTAAYHSRLSHLIHKEFQMLEIGVFKGASLRMWEEFFPLAQIRGIDVNRECLAHAGGRVVVDMVDQGDKAALSEYGLRNGGFRLIIDDGNHVMEPQILSFEVLFPMMPSGGIYIIEDTGSSYTPSRPVPAEHKGRTRGRRERIGGGLHEKGTTVKYFHRMTDMVNVGCGRLRMPDGSRSRPFPHGAAADRFVNPTPINIESIEFLKELIIIHKA